MTIKLSATLQNEYLQISSLVREPGEPIFIINKENDWDCWGFIFPASLFDPY